MADVAQPAPSTPDNPVTKSFLNYSIVALGIAFIGVTIVVAFRDLQPKIGAPML